MSRLLLALGIFPCPSTVTHIPAILESRGIEDGTTPADFAAEVYGARFNFVSGSPGYVGDLFILQGTHFTGDAPFVLQRGQDSKLIIL
jgi:hypothetical protein